MLRYKGDKFLFDDTFATTDGIFIFVLEGYDSNEITLTKEDQSSFFESIVGLKREIIHVKGFHSKQEDYTSLK